MQEEWETPEEQEDKPETFKQKLAEACVFIDDAAEEKEKENYAGSERLLAYARRLKERVLGRNTWRWQSLIINWQRCAHGKL